MFAQNGIVYSLFDSHGKRIGIPIKASSIYGKPTLRFLAKQYKLNEVLRRSSREPLKNQIERVLRDHKVNTRVDLIGSLQREGIVSIFRSNPDGRTYGVTFIDNVRKVVFNGSALGKRYSANAILDSLASKEDIITAIDSDSANRKTDTGTFAVLRETDSGSSHGIRNAISEVFDHVISADGFSGASPEALLQLNKRKIIKKGVKR
jgi:hypothetical protein